MKKYAAILAFVAALSVALLATTGSAAPEAVSKAGNGSRLQAFGSCGNLLAYAKQHVLPLVGPWGLDGGVSSSAGDALVTAPATGRVAGGTP